MSDEQLREDELVSAYLDNEATPAEIAEIEADDALLARVEQLRAVRDAVAAPVSPPPAEQRDQLISAALGVAAAETDSRLEAKIVPLHRPQRLLLAAAAAVVLLAAVVGTGLIASRSGDDSEEMAAEAFSMADAGAPAEMAAPTAEEEPMAEMDMAAADEPMAEPAAQDEPIAEEEPMAEEESMADAAADETMADAAPEATTAVAATEADDRDDEADLEPTSGSAEAEEARRSESTTDAGSLDDGADAQVVDLGTLENLESLFENIGASWSAALEDGVMASAGVCAAAVNERALELSIETLRSFVATVGTEDPLTYDARFVRRPDGTALIIYAAPPDCEIGTHELPSS